MFLFIIIHYNEITKNDFGIIIYYHGIINNVFEDYGEIMK